MQLLDIFATQHLAMLGIYRTKLSIVILNVDDQIPKGRVCCSETGEHLCGGVMATPSLQSKGADSLCAFASLAFLRGSLSITRNDVAFTTQRTRMAKAFSSDVWALLRALFGH